MDSKKLYFILLGVIGLLGASLLGGAYIANSLLEKQSQQIVKARLESQTLDGQQLQLAKAKADITKYKSLAAIAKSVVPQDKDQAQTVREIVNIASVNGVKLGNISFPSSTLGLSGSNSAATTPSPTDPKTLFSQLKTVNNIPGMYDLLITVQSDAAAPIPYTRFIDFLSGLEHNRRTALVSGITLQPDSTSSSNVSFTLTIDEYIKP